MKLVEMLIFPTDKSFVKISVLLHSPRVFPPNHLKLCSQIPTAVAEEFGFARIAVAIDARIETIAADPALASGLRSVSSRPEVLLIAVPIVPPRILDSVELQRGVQALVLSKYKVLYRLA